MTQALAGEVIDVRPSGTPPDSFKSLTLVKTPTLEVRRLILPEGREIATHQAPGEITVHCLEGKITFTAAGVPRELAAGQMLFLNPGDPHSLVALEDASVLVTKLSPSPPPAT